MNEPIVSRDAIRDAARKAVDQRMPLHEANPYLPDTTAHLNFQHEYWQHEREACAEVPD